uniref:G-protein coupled receptors family 3 profile domain-containing protein n=1 Tax=Arcella intermedia TaxID=1963864 RepID=A0A6B2L9N9_9EUKA
MFAFCILFSICVSILLFKYWDAKNIKAGQRLFLAIMILGSVLVYLSVPFWMLHQNIWFCHLRYWFICIGFTLLFGTLTLKTFRIKSIFVSSLTLKSVRALTDLEMLIPIGLLVLIDFILCITWSLVLPPQLQLEVIDIYRPAFNYYQCTWSDKVNIPLILMLIYKLLMVIFGIYLSILLWKYGFGDSMFVESRQIIFSMYNLIICGVVGAALQITLKGYDSRETLFVARSICILLSGLVTIISILFPRFDDPYGIKHEGKDISGKPISEPKAVSRTTDYDQLLKKYEELRKSYEKLSQSTSAISHKLDDEYITLSTTSTNM